MTYDEIKKNMEEIRGLNVAEASEMIGVTHVTYWKVCTRKADPVGKPRAGRKSNWEVANEIAILLKKPVSEVFPDIPEYAGQNPEIAKTLERERKQKAAMKELASKRKDLVA